MIKHYQGRGGGKSIRTRLWVHGMLTYYRARAFYIFESDCMIRPLIGYGNTPTRIHHDWICDDFQSQYMGKFEPEDKGVNKWDKNGDIKRRRRRESSRYRGMKL